MSARESITALFPAYHDWGTIASQVLVVSRVLRDLVDDWEVVVVDDGSVDHTPDVLDELLRLCPNLRVVTHEANRGYGGALKSGFAAATKDWVFYTDGDAQYDVRELRALWDAREEADLVNGFKISRSDPWHRVVVGDAYRRLVQTAFSLRVPDVDCDFRLIRRSVLDVVHLTRDDGPAPVELVLKIERAGFRCRYVPVHHYPRAHGRSQFWSPGRIVRVLAGLGRLWVDVVLRGDRGA